MPNVLNEIDMLLAQERAVLVRGQLDALASLAERKEALFARLPAPEQIPAARLTELRQAAERNHALIAATARGLKSVSRRMAEIRSATGGLSTYSSSGERRTLGGASGALERRA